MRFVSRKKINNQNIKNVVEVAREYKKEFEEITKKREKEKYLKEKMREFLDERSSTAHRGRVRGRRGVIKKYG